MQCSVRSSSIATVPYSMKNHSPASIFLQMCSSQIYSATATKMGICEFQLHCIEFIVPSTNFSIKWPRKNKTRALYRLTDRATLFSRHAVHRTGYSSDDLRGVDRRENACPPVAYISDLIRVSPRVFQLAEKWSPGKNNNFQNRAHTKHRQKI